MAVQLNSTEWVWDETRLEAADLVAEGRMTYPAIAAKLGIDRATLWHWRKHPEFKGRVIGIVQEAAATLADVAVAQKANRVRRMAERLAALDQIVAERAAAYEQFNSPGSSTGYMAPRYTEMGRQYWEADLAVMAEMRAIEQAIAKELGQLSDKHDWTVRQQPKVIDYSSLTIEELEALERIADRLATTDDPGRQALLPG